MRFAALDTKFLLAYAGGEPDAEATLEYLHSNGFTVIITESVVEQLGELQRDKTNPAHDFALYAAWMFPQWGVLDIPNKYVANGTSCVHADKIFKEGLIPNGTFIEAEILVEASCHGCELLITFSKPLLEAPSTQLNLALIENEMVAVTVAIASPEMIAERVRHKK